MSKRSFTSIKPPSTGSREALRSPHKRTPFASDELIKTGELGLIYQAEDTSSKDAGIAQQPVTEYNQDSA